MVNKDNTLVKCKRCTTSIYALTKKETAENESTLNISIEASGQLFSYFNVPNNANTENVILYYVIHLLVQSFNNFCVENFFWI